MTARLRVALVALVAFAALAAPARAAQTTALDTVVLQFWPQFDAPGVLVIVSGTVDPDTVLPVSLSWPLPTNAILNAVAYQGSNGLFELDSQQVGNDLRFVTPNGGFHIEYYDPALAVDGEQHTFRYLLTAPYTIGRLQWFVQQPANAEDVGTSLQATVRETDAFGLTVTGSDAGALPAGNTFALEFAYRKPDDALSIDVLGITEPENTHSVAPVSRDMFTGALIGAGVAVALAATAIAAAVVLLRRRPAALAAPSPPVVAAPPEVSAATPDIDALTPREREVLVLLAQGMTNREAAEALGLSPKTIGRHRDNLMRKLDVHNRAELVLAAVRAGLVEVPE